MKRLLLLLSLGSALLFSQSASADGRFYNRGYNDWGYNGWGYNRSYRAGYNRGLYRSNRFRGGNYWNVSFGNYNRGWGYGYRPYRYRRYDTGDIVGGIVLGSLISSSLNNYNYRDYGTYDRVVYRNPPVTRTSRVITTERSDRPLNSGRKLLRDLEGRCYEITRNSSGDEVRTELDPGVCNY